MSPSITRQICQISFLAASRTRHHLLIASVAANLFLSSGLGFAGDPTRAADAATALEASLEKISAVVIAAEGETAFDWTVSNELRHFQSGRDEAKSVALCDLILRHSVMDSYILNILAGWAQNPQARGKALEGVARSYPHYQAVVAACLLETTRSVGEPATRREMLESVAALDGGELEPYRSIARFLLSDTVKD